MNTSTTVIDRHFGDSASTDVVGAAETSTRVSLFMIMCAFLCVCVVVVVVVVDVDVVVVAVEKSTTDAFLSFALHAGLVGFEQGSFQGKLGDLLARPGLASYSTL